MKGFNTVSILLVASTLLTSPAIAAEAPISASEGCKVAGVGALLRVRLAMDKVNARGHSQDEAARRAFASKLPAFEAQLEQAFRSHGYTTADGLPIELDIDAFESMSSPVDERFMNSHWIDVEPDANYRSYVDRTGSIGGEPEGGKWGFELLNRKNTNRALHESGHLLGLRDKYRDVVFDDRGKHARPPRVMETDINGNIREPEKWRRWARNHGIDPGSMKVVGITDPGHESDLMGDNRNPDSRFRNKDLRHLLRAAQNCRESDANFLREQAASGPRQKGQSCYYNLGKGPLKGLSKAYSPFIPYPTHKFTGGLEEEMRAAFSSIRTPRYAGLGIDAPDDLKISCKLTQERAYVNEIYRWSDDLVGALKPSQRIARLNSLYNQIRVLGLTSEASAHLFKQINAIEAEIELETLNFEAVIDEAATRQVAADWLVLKRARGYRGYSHNRYKKLFMQSDLDRMKKTLKRFYDAKLSIQQNVQPT